jgi:hypothetical protein
MDAPPVGCVECGGYADLEATDEVRTVSIFPRVSALAYMREENRLAYGFIRPY